MTKNYTVSYQELGHFTELDRSDQLLVEASIAMTKKAYAPYSKFHVGAAARLSNGEVVLGNNQENIAYPSGLCAERVALFYAGANFPDLAVETICITAFGDLIPLENWLTPCGGCRQVMGETEMRQNAPMRVILVSQNNKVLVFNSAFDLLPLAFKK
ncbi:MAG: cytidine deaminase [Bacteroidota bacterium]